MVIDDCWQASGRDEDGRPKADPERFASGMRSLADKVHEMGLKVRASLQLNSQPSQCTDRLTL